MYLIQKHIKNNPGKLMLLLNIIKTKKEIKKHILVVNNKRYHLFNWRKELLIIAFQLNLF